MTRYELISAIAKKAGVSNSEATSMFEMFLVKLSEKISDNKIASIEGIGYFHTKKGIAKRSTVTAGVDEDPEEIDLIEFSDKVEEIGDQIKNHTFILPKTENENYNEIDSHFSLSIRSNVVPEKLNVDSHIIGSGSFQNLYGKELKKYLNNKAENLVSIIKTVDPAAKEQKIVAQTTPENNEKNFSIVSPDKIQDIAKDLDKDITPEIEDENPKTKIQKTIQIEKDKKRLESLPWNFGRKFPVKKLGELEEDKQESESPKLSPKDNLLERKPEPFRIGNPKAKKPEDESKEQEKAAKEELESEITDIIGSYQRVKPVLDESGEEVVEEKLKVDEAKIIKPEEPKEIKHDNIPKPSPIVLKKESTGHLDLKKKSETIQKKEQLNAQKRDLKKEARKRERTDDDEFYQKPRKKSKFVPIMVITFTIILTCAAIFMIDWKSIFGENSKKELVTIQNPSETNLEVSEENPQQKNPPDVDESSVVENADQKNTTEQNKDKTSGVEINTEPIKTAPVTITRREEKPKEKPVTTPVSVKEETISKSGEYYNILMGVFSSETTAESEAEKYNDMGYNAFVLASLVPGQGMRYKVRVGDFTSEENALKFKSLHGK